MLKVTHSSTRSIEIKMNFSACTVFVSLYFVSALFHMTIANFDSESYCGVITALRHHIKYDTGNVYFMQSRYMEGSAFHMMQVFYMRKILSKQFISTQSIYIEDQKTISLDSEDIPIIVIHGISSEHLAAWLNDEERRTKMNKAVWMVFLGAGEDIQEYLEGVYIPADAMFMVVAVDGGTAQITEAYNVAKGAPPTLSLFGSWSKLSISGWPSNGLSDRRKDLLGAEIKTTIQPSFGEVKTQDEDFFRSLWTTITSKLNLSITMVHTDNPSFGYVDREGVWQGMIGMVAKGKANVALGLFEDTEERRTVVDFTAALVESRYDVIFHALETSRPWSHLTAPFSNRLWFLVLASILAFATIVAGLEQVDQMLGRPISQQSFWSRFMDSLFSVFRLFCSQAPSNGPSSTAFRIVVWSLLTLSIFLSTGFSARIISRDSVVEYGVPFNNLKEMVDDGSYILGINKGTAGFKSFQDSKDPLFREVFSKLVVTHLPEMPSDIKDGLMKVCTKPKYAFVGFISAKDDIRKYINCPTMTLPNFSYFCRMTIVIEKNYPYKPFIDNVINRLRESGALQRIKSTHELLKMTRRTLFYPIEFQNVKIMLFVLVCSSAAALALLQLEILVAKNIRSSKKGEGSKKRCTYHRRQKEPYMFMW